MFQISLPFSMSRRSIIKNPSRFVQQNRALVREERSQSYLWLQTQSDTAFFSKLEARAVHGTLLIGSKTLAAGVWCKTQFL